MKRTKNQDFTFSAKIENEILKSLKLDPKLSQRFLKQQEFFNEFYFQFLNASETKVEGNILILL